MINDKLRYLSHLKNINYIKHSPSRIKKDIYLDYRYLKTRNLRLRTKNYQLRRKLSKKASYFPEKWSSNLIREVPEDCKRE